MTSVAVAAPHHAGEAWNDRVLEAIEGWRWPLSLTLAVLGIAGVVVLHAVEWWFGDLAPGTLDPYIATLPIYPLGILALIAVQNRVSIAALERFRPATDMDDAEFEAISHDLTHQPAFGALVSGLALGGLGTMIELSKEGAAGRFETYPAAFGFYLLASFAGYAPAGPWIVRSYRLLRRVERLHREVRRVDLLNPAPVHALSSVTATVGISFIAITSFSMLTDPATHQTAGGLVLTVGLVAVAVACFVVPLWGMHRRLQTERSRLKAEVARRIEATIQRLYELVDHDRPGATELQDRMAALLATRELIGRLSTWPWQPETPRWLVSALLVPIVIWGATTFLERALL
jgi:hypothetical protein